MKSKACVFLLAIMLGMIGCATHQSDKIFAVTNDEVAKFAADIVEFFIGAEQATIYGELKSRLNLTPEQQAAARQAYKEHLDREVIRCREEGAHPVPRPMKDYMAEYWAEAQIRAVLT